MADALLTKIRCQSYKRMSRDINHLQTLIRIEIAPTIRYQTFSI